MRLTRKNVRVELVRLGEGMDGDYNPDDPDDVELFRFDVYVLSNHFGLLPEWEDPSDASYCTLLPVSISKEQQKKALKYIMDEIFDTASLGENSIKKICEKLSWIEPKWLEEK